MILYDWCLLVTMSSLLLQNAVVGPLARCGRAERFALGLLSEGVWRAHCSVCEPLLIACIIGGAVALGDASLDGALVRAGSAIVDASIAAKARIGNIVTSVSLKGPETSMQEETMELLVRGGFNRMEKVREHALDAAIGSKNPAKALERLSERGVINRGFPVPELEIS